MIRTGMMVVAMATALAAQDDGNLFLVLDGEGPGTDLRLEIPRRDGSWSGTCWGSSPAWTKGRHEGTVAAEALDGGGWRLDLDLALGPDPWVPGGRGRYRVELRDDGDGLAGTWSATYTPYREPHWPDPVRGEPFAWPEPGEAGEPRELAGVATASWRPVWPQAVTGHEPVEAGEHPRLAFRPPRLAALRALAETDPAARAMKERLLANLDDAEGPGGNDKFSTWPAIDDATAFALTGEERHAAKAWEIVEATIFDNPAGHVGEGVGQDIHHAPRLVALATVYDLCHAGWDDATRRRVADEIAWRVRELAAGRVAGRGMRGTNFATWSNHNGIRMAAAGLGALAVMGDPGADGEALPGAERVALDAARQLKEFFEESTGASGTHIEGMWYKLMTTNRGLGQALTSYRNAYGWDLAAGTNGEGFVLGHLLEGEPGGFHRRNKSYDGWKWVAGDDTPGADLLLMCFGTIPPAYRPAAKTLFARQCGADGDATYGMKVAWSAPWAFANWPFELEAGSLDGLPKLLPDPDKGRYVARPRYRDGDDLLFVTNMRAGCRDACHYERSGPVSHLRLVGYGSEWFRGHYLPMPGDFRQPWTESDPGSAGPEIRSQERIGEDAVLTTMDLHHAYLLPARLPADKPRLAQRLARQRGGIGTYRVPLYRLLIDSGWRGERSMLIDASGTAGAPLLVAIADTVRWHEPDAKEDVAVEWRFPLAAGGEVTIDGAGFRVARERGTLRVACLGVADLRDTRAAGSDPGGEPAEDPAGGPDPADPADLPPHLRGKVKKKDEKEDRRPHAAGEEGVVGTGGATTACVFVLGEDPPAIAVDGNVVTVGDRRLELVDGAWRVGGD